MALFELVSFGISAKMAEKWIPKLYKKLNGIKKQRAKELDSINTLMFGDPLELAKYYIEPDCQEMNPADTEEDDFLVAKEPVMKKIDQFFQARSAQDGSNQMFVLSDDGMGKTALLIMLKLMHMTASGRKAKHAC